MKLSKVIVLSFFVMIALLGGCKKAAGPGGKSLITGSVVFKNGVTGSNDVATTATVSIAYGTNEATSIVDKTLVCDADGKFSFEGLNKGNYFIKAGYTDSHGFNYTTPGYGVTFKNKKKNLEVNIILE